MSAIALKTLNRRLTASGQGFASPPRTAPLTGPVQPPNASLDEGDGFESMPSVSPDGLTFGRTNLGGRSRPPARPRGDLSPVALNAR